MYGRKTKQKQAKVLIKEIEGSSYPLHEVAIICLCKIILYYVSAALLLFAEQDLGIKKPLNYLERLYF
jgi:hypothetical protein